MKIYKAVEFTRQTKPIEFFRPITTDDGEIVRNTCISDSGIMYKYDSYLKEDYVDDIKKSRKCMLDKNGRSFSTISQYGYGKRVPVLRTMLIAFDEDRKPLEYYEQFEADHINPSIPLSNDLRNAEFVTHQENMKRAGERGVMVKKYPKSLAHQICQMTVDGKSRLEIRNELGINGQFVDDVRAGRSHTSVSEQYLDQGFTYKTYDRSINEEIAHKVCQCIEKGITRNCDIIRAVPEIPYHQFVTAIKQKKIFLDVIAQYNIE